MRSLKRFRPSPAMVVACLALLLALGGTGYAATKLPRNSVTSINVKDFSLLNRDFKRGQVPAGPAGPAGAAGPAGPAAGPAGSSGSAKAYAHVIAGGTVEAVRAKGITDASITHTAGTGVYCIDVEGGALNAVATLETEAGSVALTIPPNAPCAATKEVEVHTFGSSGGAADKAFFILVN